MMIVDVTKIKNTASFECVQLKCIKYLCTV